MRKGLTIQGEHRYWQAWFAAHGNQICPLQPFIYLHSENGVERVDDLINKSGNQDNDALFAMVNIDNGLLQFFYAGWDESSAKLHYVEFHNTTETIRSGTLTNQDQLMNTLKQLSANDGFIHTPTPQIFDESSFYLSVRMGSKTSRFAAYAPDISGDKSQNNMEKFVQFLIQKIHPDRPH